MQRIVGNSCSDCGASCLIRLWCRARDDVAVSIVAVNDVPRLWIRCSDQPTETVGRGVALIQPRLLNREGQIGRRINGVGIRGKKTSTGNVLSACCRSSVRPVAQSNRRHFAHRNSAAEAIGQVYSVQGAETVILSAPHSRSGYASYLNPGTLQP